MKFLLPVLSLSAAVNALHFFIDGTTPKCFYEELPKDTLVVGHYTAEEWDERVSAWVKHDGISIYINVDVCLVVNSCPHVNPPLTSSRKSLTTTTVLSLSAVWPPVDLPSPLPMLATTRSASPRHPAPAAPHGSLLRTPTVASSSPSTS